MLAYGSETISYLAYANWREVPPDAPFRYFVSYTRVVKVGSAHIKSANVRVCAQHKQWRAFYYRARVQALGIKSMLRGEANNPLLAEIHETGAFRTTVNHPDDYVIPDRPAELTSAGVTVGYDTKIETKTRRYLASAPNREKPARDTAITETDNDPSIGYWQQKCAEGRKWHKSERFSYPYEMNRG